MNSTQFKKLVKMRINDSLEEYVERMEAMFGDSYWEEDQNVGNAVRAFCTDMLERYEQPQDEPSEAAPQPKQEEEEDSDDRGVDDHKGPEWVIAYKLADGPDEHYIDRIRAPTQKHAGVLFNRKHSEEGCEVLSITRGD